MPQVRHLTSKDYRVMPWKNHRGTTTEIAIWPEGSDFHKDPFLWRVSTAHLSSSGVFSQFPGYDRTITVLDPGGELELNHDVNESPERVGFLEPHEFKAEWQTVCEIGEKPVRDFNLMVRRGKMRARFEVLNADDLDGSPMPCDTRWVLAYCVSGDVKAAIEDGQAVRLKAGETFRAENGVGEKFSLALEGSSDAGVILIRISPAV